VTQRSLIAFQKPETKKFNTSSFSSHLLVSAIVGRLTNKTEAQLFFNSSFGGMTNNETS
jgi:hypothetical protein